MWNDLLGWRSRDTEEVRNPLEHILQLSITLGARESIGDQDKVGETQSKNERNDRAQRESSFLLHWKVVCIILFERL